MKSLELLAASEETELSRRSLLRFALAAPLVAAGAKVVLDSTGEAHAMPVPKAMPKTETHISFKLPPLPYAYSALNPYIDTTTMRLHHDKHHQGYVDKLNKAVAGNPEYAAMTPQALLMNLNKLPESIRDAVRNNAGGHVNHSMFWQLMSPNGGGAPNGEIGRMIASSFGSFNNFKTAFNTAGEKRFGSGWVWLVADKGRLKILSTPNQDSPLLMNQFPIIGNDVWEHAYYLKYRNKRAEYLKAWWNVVNWDNVNSRVRYMQRVKM